MIEIISVKRNPQRRNTKRTCKIFAGEDFIPSRLEEREYLGDLSILLWADLRTLECATTWEAPDRAMEKSFIYCTHTHTKRRGWNKWICVDPSQRWFRVRKLWMLKAKRHTRGRKSTKTTNLRKHIGEEFQRDGWRGWKVEFSRWWMQQGSLCVTGGN